MLSVDEESVLHQQVTSGLDPDATRLARIISQRHILGVDDLHRALIRARTHRGGNGLLPRVLQRLLTTGLFIVDKDVFNPMTGVSAYDSEDGNITSRISVSGTVDVNRPGSYVLTYRVTDRDGATASASRTITVINDESTLTAPAD